jgi:hypothetical protein
MDPTLWSTREINIGDGLNKHPWCMMTRLKTWTKHVAHDIFHVVLDIICEKSGKRHCWMLKNSIEVNFVRFHLAPASTTSSLYHQPHNRRRHRQVTRYKLRGQRESSIRYYLQAVSLVTYPRGEPPPVLSIHIRWILEVNKIYLSINTFILKLFLLRRLP